ncbi:MAG: TlpA disulfide reductase family protein [Peptococcaceae bacterium]|nr:TlpA disulfide reductase family protein [Peptococcaceae bacterium]
MKRIIFLGLCAAFLLTILITGLPEGKKKAADSPAAQNSFGRPAENQEGAPGDGPGSGGAGDGPAGEEEIPPAEENPLVPDFTLEANNGEEVSLSDYAGKVVILNFWASWCPPCKEEMPEFQELNRQLEDSEEAVLLMLNQTDGQRETKEKAEKYLTDNEFDFLNLYDQGEVGYEIFGVSRIPTTVVIDKEGRLSDYVLGMTDYDTVMEMIEEAK